MGNHFAGRLLGEHAISIRFWITTASTQKFEGYCTDIFFNHAMQWIDQCAAEDKPFFLYLATNTPHVPNIVADEYSKPYRGKHDGKPIPDTFYGMIANIDENLGKLEAFLRQKQLRDNTILIYMSDNGTQSAQSTSTVQRRHAGQKDQRVRRRASRALFRALGGRSTASTVVTSMN